jgi:hypothetical protein
LKDVSVLANVEASPSENQFGFSIKKGIKFSTFAIPGKMMNWLKFLKDEQSRILSLF